MNILVIFVENYGFLLKDYGLLLNELPLKLANVNPVCVVLGFCAILQ